MTNKSFDYVVIALPEFTTKSHKYKALVENSVQSVIDIGMLDCDMLSDFVADTINEDGVVIDSDVTMRIWKQSHVLIMTDMIYIMEDNVGGTTKVKRS
jgi:hypothetical protein